MKRNRTECYRCGKPAVAGGYCAEHEQDQARAQKARYDERIKRGLCPGCGKKPEAGVLCDACRDTRKPGKSVPYERRTTAGKGGLPRFRLPRDFGERCARVVDAGLVEQATPLLDALLNEFEKTDKIVR